MSTFEISDNLLNSPLVRRESNDADVAWLTGQNRTKPAVHQEQIRISFERMYRKCPDPAGYRIRRRRVGGKSLALPVEIVGYFTEGERAVLNMIANAIKQKGMCDWCIDKIQRLAGVCRRTVQNTVKKACALGFLTKQLRPVPGGKNLTNILRITIQCWKSWLKRMSTGFDLGIGCKPVHPTEDKYIYFSNNEDKTHDYNRVETKRRGLMKGNKPDD